VAHPKLSQKGYFNMKVFICRWQNGDLSIVSARDPEDAVSVLDEVADATDAELFETKELVIHCLAVGGQALHGIDLKLHAGEIVGIAGVSGNGQSELLEVLAGLRAPAAGQMDVCGARFDADTWLDPRRARALRIAHVPEDRQSRGLVMDFAVWEAAALGHERQRANCRRGWMRHGAMRAKAASLMQRFDVRPRDVDLRCAGLSGGNQQKLVLAREIEQRPRVLLIGQPTRGVDIGAIEFIHAQLRALRDAGCALLLLSSELDEILALADRVLVMHAGRISGELSRAQCDETRLGLLMAGQG
jgi:simple sugar transport system ATP-binding protein